MPPVLIILVLTTIFIAVAIFYISCIQKCPSDKVMVIYGKVKKADGTEATSICMHGGARFIIPIIQSVEFLDLNPISIRLDLHKVHGKNKSRIDIKVSFVVAISTEPGVMENAAERLLGLKTSEIHDIANDIITGQIRLTVATKEFEEIDENQDVFLTEAANNIETELKKLGLLLIRVNIVDIAESNK